MKKLDIVNLLEYILILTVIFGSNTMIERDQSIGLSPMIFYYLISATSAILLFFQRHNAITDISLRDVFLLTFIALLCVVIPRYNIRAGIIQWVLPLFLLSLYLSTCEGIRVLWQKYIIIMFWIAIISLFFYVFGTVLGIIKPTNTAYYTYDNAIKSCNCYYKLYYEAQTNQFSLVAFSYRNTGIFIEAPFYNFMLCIALCAELAFMPHPRKIVVAVLTVAIITTFATTGMICLIEIIVLRLYLGREGRRRNEFRILMVPILILIALYATVALLENKISGARGESSYNIRTEHMITFFRMWLKKPLFGFGYGNTDAFYAFSRYRQGFSVGLPAILGFDGLFMFLAYFVPWIRNTLKSFSRSDVSLYIWIGSFTCLFLTALIYEPVSIFILCTQLFGEMNCVSLDDDESGELLEQQKV